MKTALIFPITAIAIFGVVTLAYCEPRTSQPEPAQQATTPARKVYELSEDSALHELISDASANAYAVHAIDKNGIAMSQPDPVLLRFMKERAMAGGNAEPASETAYAAPK